LETEDRIVLNPEICAGKPIIKGTRLKVDFILELLAEGWTYTQIQNEYDIQYEDILAALNYAHKIISEEQIFNVPSN
jgi:uncharacterized protein (DUF433 family)